MTNSKDPRRNPPPKFTLVVGGDSPSAPRQPSGSAPEPALNPSVEAALKTWSNELIDTGGRNRLLYYRHLRSLTLDLGRESKADAGAVAALIDHGRAMLSALFPHQPPDDEDDGDPPDEAGLIESGFDDALKRARAIRRKAREHFEEQGIQTLYLAFGFATWTQVGPGPTPNAPILLSAAELGQRGRLDPDFSLIVSDEWELNPTLLHVLRTEFGAQFDEQELDELAQPSEFHALTERLGRICGEIPGFGVREGTVLGTFSYAKLPMVRDLLQAGAAVAKHPLVAALAGDEAAKDNLRAMYAPGDDDGEFRRPVPPAREFLVLDADGTQSEVINSVRAGNHLVVNGPPGTGKSQTIANLIAALAADGKSVLFVAEKRAAIDAVTKRLDQVGLGDLVFDLHARNRSRRQIAQQLADALAASRVAQPADTTENDRALVRSRDRLTNVNEALHQPVPPWDVTAYDLQGRLLGVKEADRTDLRIPKSALDKLAGEERQAAREALRDCVARQLGITKDGPWRKALEGETLKDIGEAADALEAIGSLLATELPKLQSESAALSVATDQPRPGTLIEAESLARNAKDSAAAAIERQAAAHDRERAAERAVLETTDALREAEEESRLSADELAETKTGHREAGQSRDTAAKPFTNEAASAPTSELARIVKQTALLRGGGLGRLSASLFKRGRYRAAQRTLAALFAAPPLDLREALDLLDGLVGASRASDRSGKRLDAAEKAAGKASGVRDLAESEHRAAERELADATSEREMAVADCERWAQIDHEPLARAASAVRAPLRIAASHAAISKPGGMDLAALERELHDLERDGDDAYAIAALQQARLKLQQIGIAQFADAAKTDGWDADKAVRVFDHAWLNSVYRAVRRGREEVAGFDAEQHEASWAEFRASDAAHIASGAQRIKRQWAEGVIRVRNSHGRQQEIILREAAKQRRHLPMRDLFHRAPNVLTALKPCWAMSPLVVAQLLPASPPPFDVVIFDEASQIPPADAISSLLRGRQAVVAGDEKQLPPTTFFTQSSADEEEREDEEELPTDHVESILNVMSSLLSSRANKSLGWHYRSKDERLIAFANHHVYDGRMTTFPGALADDCISHVEVPFSQRAVQQRGSNSAEVERVVELILQHARERPRESLGVIAFGLHHANRIEETLLQARRDRPELDEFFSEAAGEPFFVKNLERVQGDERDAIILSVGYGRGEDGRMRYAFGPINQEGGHRRLNVAITRAKRRMTVVSTFGPNDLDRSRIRAEGARLLCDYITYAATSGTELGRVDVDKPPLNDFERDIKQRLEEAAADIRIETQYGASGYRIDFAAFHPEQPGRPVLAIEADGASYHSSKSARDRDRLRQEHLERLGWRFHRIWSTEYFRNPEREIDRAVAAWRSAVAAADAPEPEPAEEPAAAEAPAPEPLAPQPQRGPKPNLGPKRPSITDYRLFELRQMVDWVNSDDILRTEEETIREVSRELGFQRRGSRIDAAIRNAIRRPPKPPHRIDLPDL